MSDGKIQGNVSIDNDLSQNGVKRKKKNIKPMPVIVTIPKNMIGTSFEALPGVLGTRGKRDIYLRDTGEQRPNFEGKRRTKAIL